MSSTPPPSSAVHAQPPAQLISTLMRAGWSQEQIALAADTSQGTVSRIYSGRHKYPRYHVVDHLRRLVLELADFQEAAC